MCEVYSISVSTIYLSFYLSIYLSIYLSRAAVSRVACKRSKCARPPAQPLDGSNKTGPASNLRKS